MAADRAARDRAPSRGLRERSRSRGWRWWIWPLAAPVGFLAGYLENELIIGVALFSFIVAGVGVASGDIGWVIGMVGAGAAGLVLTFLPMARHWRVRRQVAVHLGAVIALLALLVIHWRLS